MPDQYAKQDMREKPKAASQVKEGSIFDRLTDPSTFQASHRARFNERPDVAHDHIKLQEPSNINKKYDPAAPTVNRKPANAAAAPKPAAGAGVAPSATSPRDKPKAASQVKGGSIFDRLTDPSTYHGTHKERFNADGTGRGLAGRDSVAKGSGTVGGRVGDLSSQVSRK